VLTRYPGPSILDRSVGADLAAHLPRRGELPPRDAVQVAEACALHGRGGAAFPVAAKLRSVAAASRATGRRPVVVANGAEGEPASAKDAVLLTRSPHLVLDGLQFVGRALGADTLLLAAAPSLLPALEARLAERRDDVPVRLHAVPERFLAGERSALVSSIDGGPPLPRAKVPPIRERGVDSRPTLVQNVETLARLALAARGDTSAASRTLVTRREEISGLPRVDVVDVPLGRPLAEVVRVDDGVGAVLVGGYHGTWLSADVASQVTLDASGLAAAGSALGAGVLAALPATRCGLRETARVVAYLAAESAGQCGPCLNGLPRIAAALAELALPARVPTAVLEDVMRWSGLVTGRGACTHPDGTVRLVRSALQVFGTELALHDAGECTAAHTRPYLPAPRRIP